MAYRQTNHNGRVSTKTGSVYNRNHNDHSFNISHADNVHADMIMENIIIHYDENNHPSVIDINDKTYTTIDEHEHQLYETLFTETLSITPSPEQMNISMNYARKSMLLTMKQEKTLLKMIWVPRGTLKLFHFKQKKKALRPLNLRLFSKTL